MKKPIIDEAIYTKIALFIEPLINATGIKRDAKVSMLIVLIGNSRFKYKITIVKAINIALKVISLAFIN
jgi:single-stranded DNA-specific DHH superfamily exonuclease